jgi:hypothetical protein
VRGESGDWKGDPGGGARTRDGRLVVVVGGGISSPQTTADGVAAVSGADDLVVVVGTEVEAALKAEATAASGAVGFTLMKGINFVGDGRNLVGVD